DGQEPRGEVVSFREYAELYHESWADPEIRWLMSTVPTSMIFDDHDVRDDWNTWDVHHSYVARATYARPTKSQVLQLVCSPVHNEPPEMFHPAFALSWAAPIASALRWLADRRGISPDPVRWRKISGPHFGNSIASLVVRGRSARFTLETARSEEGLVVVAELELAPPHAKAPHL
ncbi:hypothetical protein ABZ529_36035, partial [Nocardia sp. NPDC019302]